MGRLASVAVGACAVLAGCDFTAQRADDDDSPGGSCFDRWRAGTVTLETPARLDELGSIMGDRDPYVSPDELTIYFSRAVGLNADVFAATRTSTSALFSLPVPRTEISSTRYDGRLTMSADERIAIVVSDRMGTKGGNDVWISTRANPQDPLGPFDKTRVDNVNTGSDELDPELSADGLHLYIARDAPQRIMVAVRATTNDSFDGPAEVGGLNSNLGDSDPALSPDERVIVFASARGDAVDDDLWYASRSSKTADFDTPVRVPTINSATADADPALSADGCRLYFASLRSGTWAIYVTEVSP